MSKILLVTVCATILSASICMAQSVYDWTTQQKQTFLQKVRLGQQNDYSTIEIRDWFNYATPSQNGTTNIISERSESDYIQHRVFNYLAPKYSLNSNQTLVQIDNTFRQAIINASTTAKEIEVKADYAIWLSVQNRVPNPISLNTTVTNTVPVIVYSQPRWKQLGLPRSITCIDVDIALLHLQQ